MEKLIILNKKNTKNIFNKVIHLSDLHVRPYTRHDEYIKVFDWVIQWVSKNCKKKSKNKTCCVITGDLLHSKNLLSPECIMVLRNFLDTLSKHIPVIVIPGNHDANLRNVDRLDGLTPILEPLVKSAKNQLFYIKESGIFQLNNILWIHYSLLDNKKWEKVYEDSLEYVNDNLFTKIGLYHGPIKGAVSSTGWKMTEGERELKHFANCDLIMLGDIHEHQYINQDKTGGYAGSLIQQNFGESVEKHGFLIWDLFKKTSTWQRVPNDYGMVTIKIENDQLVYPKKEFIPINSQYRLLTPVNSTTFMIKKWKKEMLDKMAIKHIAVVRTKKNNSSIIQNNISKIEVYDKINIKSNKIIPNLENSIKDYMDFKCIKDENIYKNINDFHIKLCEKNILSYKKQNYESCNHGGWILQKLEWDNMFCYGENNSWSPKKGVTCLISSNHTGKSALIDILLYCITDHCSRGKTASDFINFGKNSFYVKAYILCGNIKYIIHKKGEKNKNNRVSVKVDFYKIEENKKINLNETTTIKTKHKIVQMFGTLKNIEMSSFALQNNMLGLLKLSQHDRKIELSSILGLSDYEKLNKAAKKELSSISGALKEAERQESKISVLTKEESDILSEKIENLSFDETVLQEKIEALQSKIITMSHDISKPVNPEELYREINRIKEKITKIKKENQFTNLDKKTPTYILLEDSPHSTDIMSPDIILKQIENLEKKVFEAGNLFQNKSCKEDNWEEHLDNIKQLRNSDKNYFDSKARRNKNEKIKLFKLNAKLKEKEEKYTIAKEAWEIAKKNETSLKLKQEKINKKIIKNKAKLVKIRNEKIQYKLDISNSAESKKIIEDLNTRIKELTYQKIIIEKYTKMVHVNGVPSYILKRILPHLESCVNEFLQNIVNFQIKMEITEKSWLLYRITNETEKIPLECCSGFEMRISSLALRLALRDISMISYPNGMIFDEAFNSADQIHRAKIGSIIDCIKPRVDWLLVISHMEELQSYGDNVLFIQKNKENESKIIE